MLYELAGGFWNSAKALVRGKVYVNYAIVKAVVALYFKMLFLFYIYKYVLGYSEGAVSLIIHGNLREDTGFASVLLL